ncbi:MAG: hypothetical protein HKN72_17500 [Gemmatimonadetes bacterium]|nr:hypothetical protein [Gemmatimonadota bacterium]
MIALTATLAACSSGGPQSTGDPADLEAYSFMVGSWEGELEYLDYGDNRTLVALPTSLSCELGADGTSLDLRFSYVEPNGRVETSTERLTVTPEGLYMGDLWQIRDSADQVLAGVFRVVLERVGEDNGQMATLVNSIIREGDELTITSTVTYISSGESLQRNQYRLRRSDRAPEHR